MPVPTPPGDSNTRALFADGSVERWGGDLGVFQTRQIVTPTAANQPLDLAQPMFHGAWMTSDGSGLTRDVYLGPPSGLYKGATICVFFQNRVNAADRIRLKAFSYIKDWNGGPWADVVLDRSDWVLLKVHADNIWHVQAASIGNPGVVTYDPIYDLLVKLAATPP